MKSLFEQLGGTYTRQGDYCLPNICLPPEEERPIGIYGQRRRVYLKGHHRVLYYSKVTYLGAEKSAGGLILRPLCLSAVLDLRGCIYTRTT